MTITEQPDTTTGPAIGFSDVQAAAERLRGVAHHTPVLTSRTLDAMTGAPTSRRSHSSGSAHSSSVAPTTPSPRSNRRFASMAW